MKRIKLTQGKYALVDNEDFELLNQWKWSCAKGVKYARRVVQKNNIITSIYLHRFIMNAPNGKEVDHINGDGLDNRKVNLRICTGAENRRNHKLLVTNKSGFNGVSWDKRINKWSVCISVNDKTVHGGSFEDKIEAAVQYNQLATQYYGKFARLNSIGGSF